MGKRVLAGLGVLVLTSASLEAQTLNIDHQPVACAVAERFPRLEARFTPGDAVATARVLFQSENTKHWYAVAMKAEGPAFSGVLPKPKKSLKAFQYYIEVTDKALATSRTANYTTNVVANSAGCQGKVVAGSLGSASVLLQAPEGAAAVPVGFASNGVVAAGSGSAAAGAGAAAAGTAAAAGGGGGLSTGALVGIVAGVGAAGAGVAVAVTHLGGGAGTTYSGPFNGQWVVTSSQTGPGPGTQTCFFDRAFSGTMTLTLEQSNGTANGQAEITATQTLTGVSGAPNCSSGGEGPGGPWHSRCPVSGTPGNLACSEQTSSVSGNVTAVHTFTFSGALSGGIISGTVTYTETSQGGGTNPGGAFTTADSASTTFPVTLR